MIFWSQVVEVFVALLIITDSVGNLPFFIGLTDGFSKAERRKVFLTAIFTGLILLGVFAFTGSLIFRLFDLTINDIRIAGGILLILITIEILFRGKVEYERKEDIGTVPLGCPILVGPGAITTIILLSQLYNINAVILGTLLCFAVIAVVLFFGEVMFNFLGRSGSLIVTKISAIIIASIAVRFVRQGIQGIFGI